MAVNYEYREKVLKAMHDLIMVVGDENLIDTWFMYGISDGADTEDFKEIVRDESDYNRIYKLFKTLSQKL